MVPKADIEFIPVNEPITEPVTKFGGQPVWIEESQWPISRATGKPMQFICQIALDKEIFGEVQGQMAYVFMTDDFEDDGIADTWEPDGGENAVIIQPSNTEPRVKFQSLRQGPSLYSFVHFAEKDSAEKIPCELAVKLQKGFDPAFLPGEKRYKEEESEDSPYLNTGTDKVGGIPRFIHDDELPYDDWKMLLQFWEREENFWISFGTGCGYIFINNEGTEGKFLWQS